jgi:decaprenyl-phosphate phosphoribosyltransferase
VLVTSESLLPPHTRQPAGWLRCAVGLIGSARPAHAAKSVLLVPLAFLLSPHWTAHALVPLALATAAFVLTGSAVYLGNDVADRHRDREHPVKRHRPIAAGTVPVAAAIACGATLLALVVVIVADAPSGPWWPLAGYLVLNVAYSATLKHIPLVDVGTVALGLVLRVVQGYLAIGAPTPPALLVAVFATALVMLFGKRRDELSRAGVPHRPALAGYSTGLIDQLLPVCGALAIGAGLLYLSTASLFGGYRDTAMLLSVPFGLYLLARYLQLVLADGAGDPVRLVLRDRLLVGTAAVWATVLGCTVVLAHIPGVVTP